MFSVPVAFVIPHRRASRLRWAAERLTRLAEILERRAVEPMDRHADHGEHLAELRHRILSRYY